MKIIIISLFGFNASGREANLIDYTFKDYDVLGISSDFYHAKKEYIDYSKISNSICEIKHIHVPSYKKNLSIGRIISHIYFAIRLKKLLSSLNYSPELIYCAMPTSTAAYVAGKFCKKNNIPFVVDVIDLWPDSLIPIVRFKKLIEVIVWPWKWTTRKVYRMADYISGESKKYTEIAHNVNPKVPFSYTYLGVDREKVKRLLDSSKIFLDKPDGEIWIGYGGSLGQSYDFEVILHGLRKLTEEKIPYKMWFIGDGEKAAYIKENVINHNLNVEITGRLPYKDLLKYLSYCDIAINSFNQDTLVVHSYKFNDYIATGCFVLNNLPGETADMIDKYKVGYNFNTKTFNHILIKTISNWNEIKHSLSSNIRELVTNELETKTIYYRLGKEIKTHLFKKELTIR